MTDEFSLDRMRADDLGSAYAHHATYCNAVTSIIESCTSLANTLRAHARESLARCIHKEAGAEEELAIHAGRAVFLAAFVESKVRLVTMESRPPNTDLLASR